MSEYEGKWAPVPPPDGPASWPQGNAWSRVYTALGCATLRVCTTSCTRPSIPRLMFVPSCIHEPVGFHVTCVHGLKDVSEPKYAPTCVCVHHLAAYTGPSVHGFVFAQTRCAQTRAFMHMATCLHGQGMCADLPVQAQTPSI